MISLKSVTVERSGKQLLKSLTIDITPGKITAIVGPNGSGKSTLLKAMAGVLSINSGELTLDDTQLHKWPRKKLAMALAYLPQSSERPLGMTIEEVVSCGRFAHLPPWAKLSNEDKRCVTEALIQTELDQKASSPVDNLSGGEMQRVWLATVLAQGADIVLLDEPSSYLDLSHQLELMALIRRLNEEQGKTIVLVIHDLNQAMQWCDEVIVVQSGNIVKSGLIQLLSEPALLESVFQLKARFFELPGLAFPILHADRLAPAKTQTAGVEK